MKNYFAFFVAGGLIIGAFLITSPERKSDVSSGSENFSITESLVEDEYLKELLLKDRGFTDDNSLGNPDARVLIKQYSDYSCEPCFRFWEEVLPEIEKKFISTGKVRYEYKNSIIIGGLIPAEASWCANEQGAFWQYHDTVFARFSLDRQRWSLPEIHLAYAELIGLDMKAFDRCFRERRYRSMVEESSLEASLKEYSLVPVFEINNQKIFGFNNFEVFEKIIEEELGKF